MKTKYVSNFVLRHKTQMRVLRAGGLLGKKNKEWRNIAEHCVFEAIIADILAEHLCVDRSTVICAALFHDWYKRREIENMRRFGAKEGYEISAKYDRIFLQELNVPDDLIDLAHSNIPKKDDLHLWSIEQKILFFADWNIQGIKLMNFVERVNASRKNKVVIEMSDSLRSRYSGRSLHEFGCDACAKIQQRFEIAIGLAPGKIIDFLQNQFYFRCGSL